MYLLIFVVKKVENAVQTQPRFQPVNFEDLLWLMVRWICINMHPYTIVEEAEYRNQLLLLRPDTKDASIPKADVVRNRQRDLFEVIEQTFRQDFRDNPVKRSFTPDVWSSISRRAYLGEIDINTYIHL